MSEALMAEGDQGSINGLWCVQLKETHQAILLGCLKEKAAGRGNRATAGPWQVIAIRDPVTHSFEAAYLTSLTTFFLFLAS